MKSSPHVLGLRCFSCGHEVDETAVRYDCDRCGGNLEVRYDYASMARELTRERLAADPDPSVWRYAPALPVLHDPDLPLVQVGGTPLYPAARLARELGLGEVFLKDDGRNPSASFKDRAGVVALAKAHSLGRKVITGASTGNAASSLACLAASAGVRPIVFVPEAAPPAKITQLLVFGATVLAVRGTYDQAFDLCLEATREYGWYNRNTGYNPYTREGKKTCSFEIAEQLGWRCPDLVFVSVGDGNILSGLWKGFQDLQALGLLERCPRMVGVQAEGSNAISQAFRGDGEIRPVTEDTLADSISVSLPRDGLAAVRALQESGGFTVEVSDQEILDAIPLTARTESVFAEPAGAAAVAGLKKAAAEGLVGEDALVTAVITGNGLKDIASAQRSVAAAIPVAPDLDDLRQKIQKLDLQESS